MSKIVNPVAVRYSNKLNQNSLQVQKITREAVSGLKKDQSLVDNTLGLKSEAIAKLGSVLIKQISSNLNIINTASATLKNIESTIHSIQEMLLNLDNADSETLQAAQNDYVEKVTFIIDTLTSREFGGIKLFDGRRADPTDTLTNEALPPNAEPLDIIVGINYNHRIRISIPRLLAGDGSVADVDAPGRFTPLFPWNPAALSSIITITNTVDAAIGINPVTDPSPAAQKANTESINNGGGGIIANAQVAGVLGRPDNYWISQGAATEIEDQVENAKPIGANLFINAIFDTAKAVLRLGPIANPVLMKNSIIALAQAADAVGSEETVEAINDINIILTAAINIPGTPDNQRNNLEPVINAMAIPADASPVVKAIYNVVKSTASSKFITSYPSLAEMKAGAVAAAKAATSANPGLAAGDILTPASRAIVKSILEKALVKINSVQINLIGQQKNLNASAENLQVAVIQHRDAANNYSGADYTKIISNLLELFRGNKVANINFVVAEQAINRVLEQLINSGQEG